MIDLKQRGSHDLEVIIYKLKRHTDVLEKLILGRDEEIKELRAQLKDQIKSNN